jgi:hypothetical protein
MITGHIEWRTEHAPALEESRAAGKLVLVDFFNPN